MLTEANINRIEKEIKGANISFSHLADDLLDHICCDVECEMNNGESFENAYKKIRKRIGINGLKEIEKDTLFLIDKSYRIMKKTMNVTGMVSLALLAFASLFKIMHWPGAGIMLVLGFFLLCFIFFPTVIFVLHKESGDKNRLFLHASLFIGGFSLTSGILFKIMHWPGANWLLLIGFTVMLLVFLPTLLVVRYKAAQTRIEIFILLTGLLSLIVYETGSWFKIMHWPGASLLLFFGSIFLTAVFLPLYAYKEYKESDSVSSNFIFVLIAFIYFTVFSFLSNMNLSREVFSDLIKMEENTVISQKLVEQSNKKMYNLISTDTTYSGVLQAVSQIRYESDELVKYMQALKIELIQYTDGYHAPAINTDSTITLKKVNNMSDINKTSEILLANGNKSLELKRKISSYIDLLEKQVPQSKQTINSLLSLNDRPEDIRNPHIQKWENHYFARNILLSDIAILSNFQQNVRLAEYEAVNSLIRK